MSRGEKRVYDYGMMECLYVCFWFVKLELVSSVEFYVIVMLLVFLIVSMGIFFWGLKLKLEFDLVCIFLLD